MNAFAKERETGMILINVLVIVMLATAVLALTIAGDDENVERSVRLRSAAQAQAIARGGELSAISALRRDLARGNSVDMLTEEWAQIADVEAPIENGTFTFTVSDAQARFNLTNLARGDVASLGLMSKIAMAAGLQPEQIASIVEAAASGGLTDDFTALLDLGLTQQQIATLAAYVTILPEPTQINLATAPEGLLAILFASPARARSIVSLRAAPASFTDTSLRSAGLLRPPGTTLTSNYFWARSRVTVNGTSQQLTSLLYRHTSGGQPRVLAIRRWKGAAPIQAPALP